MSIVAVASICGKIAPIASIVVFLAPMPTMQQIKREGTVGALPLLPYSSMSCSAFLWTTYGFLKHEPHVWGSNLVGLVLGLYYFSQFVQYSPKSSPTLPGTVQQHIQAFALTAILATILCLSGLTNAVEIIGKVAVILCLAMFASPLAALKTVVRTKSSKSIPLPFTLASLVNCFTWTMFGLYIMNDPNIYLTNALAMTFGLAQLALKLMYPSQTEGSVSRNPSRDSSPLVLPK